MMNEIRELLLNARQRVAVQVNTELLSTYWNVGKIIVEHEQEKKDRADYGKQTLKELMAGLAVWGILVLVILMIVSRHRLAVACGLLVGLAAAAWLLWHMYHHLDIALDMDATHAGRHIQASAMKRFLVMAVVLALAMTQYRYIHPVGTVLGMFGMKISAFMQPKIHRLMASHKGSSVKS